MLADFLVAAPAQPLVYAQRPGGDDLELVLVMVGDHPAPGGDRRLGDAESCAEFLLGAEVLQNIVVRHAALSTHRYSFVNVDSPYSLLMTAKERGERLARRRKWLRLTQEDVAEAAEISQGTLPAIEAGKTELFEVPTLLGLAKALGVSPYWIWTGSELPVYVADAEFRELLTKLSAENRRTYLEIGKALLRGQGEPGPPFAPPKGRPPAGTSPRA